MLFVTPGVSVFTKKLSEHAKQHNLKLMFFSIDNGNSKREKEKKNCQIISLNFNSQIITHLAWVNFIFVYSHLLFLFCREKKKWCKNGSITECYVIAIYFSMNHNYKQILTHRRKKKNTAYIASIKRNEEKKNVIKLMINALDMKVFSPLRQ